MMRKLYAAAALGFVSACFMACLFPDLSGLDGNDGTGAGKTTGPGSGAGQGTGGSGTSTEGTGGADTGGGDTGAGGQVSGCQLQSGQKGSKGVLFKPPGSRRCIDATETSWAEYLKFYNEALNQLPDLGAYAPVCSWKKQATDYAPESYIYMDFGSDNTEGQYDQRPVEGVDWCDAAIYCQWAGKELCGDRTGVPIKRLLDAGWQETTEWYYACMANRLPDAGYDDPNCYPPDSGNEFDRTLDVGTCPGAIGMDHSVSNVWEWEANCTGDHNTMGVRYDDCRYRGWTDPFVTGNPDLDEANHCASENNNPTIRDPHAAGEYKPTSTGIRCCWGPP